MRYTIPWPGYVLVMFLLLTSILAQSMPDTNFKSIHQIQSEEHSKDSLNNHDSALTDTEQVRTMINFTAMVIVIIILVIAISAFLIARRIYRTKK